MSKPYYITTAIAYPNGDPHVGHAYEYIATDAIARFKRLDGFDVRFLTGTDVHGLKMAETAAAEGIPTAELARRNSDVFQRMQERLNISFDRFIRTSDADHYEASKEIWRRMNEAGDIYLDAYKGWYSVRDERFFTEAETTVGSDGVRIATETGAPVTWTEEQTYFFRLSAYADKLLAHYEAHPEFIEPEVRRNEVVSFVSGGLRDLSISRTTFDWGVPVPDHPDHVMYVWVDALTNYLTGVGFPDTSSELFKRFWPADLHMIGKDIIRFHTVYWPAFLMSAGIELPRKVFAHGFVLNRGEKMSKSVGNVVDPLNLVDTFGVDQVRYFFLREVPFGQDGSYSEEAIIGRINADLANELGNLAQRSLSMVAKNLDGIVPEPANSPPTTRTCLRPPTGCSSASAAITTRRPCIWRSRRSGRCSARPTSTSPRRSRGCCARPIRRGPASLPHRPVHDAGGRADRDAAEPAGDARVDGQAARPARPARGPADVRGDRHAPGAGDGAARAGRRVPALSGGAKFDYALIDRKRFPTSLPGMAYRGPRSVPPLRCLAIGRSDARHVVSHLNTRRCLEGMTDHNAIGSSREPLIAQPPTSSSSEADTQVPWPPITCGCAPTSTSHWSTRGRSSSNAFVCTNTWQATTTRRSTTERCSARAWRSWSTARRVSTPLVAKWSLRRASRWTTTT